MPELYWPRGQYRVLRSSIRTNTEWLLRGATMRWMLIVNSQGWIQNLTGFAPFAAAVAALFVGLLQWRIQGRHLKHNLYEKRYAIYDATRAYLAEIMKKNGKDENDAYLQFRAATDPAEFLFPDSVYAHVKMIGDLGLDFCTHQAEFDRMRKILSQHLIPPEPAEFQEAKEHYPRTTELMKQNRHAIIAELEGNLKAVFRRHLKVEDERPWFDSVEAALDRWNACGEAILASRYRS